MIMDGVTELLDQKVKHSGPGEYEKINLSRRKDTCSELPGWHRSLTYNAWSVHAIHMLPGLITEEQGLSRALCARSCGKFQPVQVQAGGERYKPQSVAADISASTALSQNLHLFFSGQGCDFAELPVCKQSCTKDRKGSPSQR